MADAAPSPSELSVLKQLWTCGAQSAREVHNALLAETAWSYSTTRTLLARMTEKELVARQDVHGLSVFEARVEKVSLMSRLIRNFAADVLELDGPMPATAFANSKLFSEAEAEALTRLLEEGSEQ
jgi:BlaI family penicillinase repressor